MNIFPEACVCIVSTFMLWTYVASYWFSEQIKLWQLKKNTTKNFGAIALFIVEIANFNTDDYDYDDDTDITNSSKKYLLSSSRRIPSNISGREQENTSFQTHLHTHPYGMSEQIEKSCIHGFSSMREVVCGYMSWCVWVHGERRLKLARRMKRIKKHIRA